MLNTDDRLRCQQDFDVVAFMEPVSLFRREQPLPSPAPQPLFPPDLPV